MDLAKEKKGNVYYSFSWKGLRAELHPFKLLNRIKTTTPLRPLKGFSLNQISEQILI